MSDFYKECSRRWFEEGWNERRSEVVDELLADDCVGEMQSLEVIGADAFKQVQAAYLAMFPDLKFEIECIAANGDEVAVRWSATGTHTGDGAGLKATREPVKFRGTTWHRYRNGKLAAGRDDWNHAALLQQLNEAASRQA